MSDTEDEGTFDKEAEREKLREQFRREEENRRSTEHMSDLLLKGATMTNKHCDNCGDPIFRYQGQEFCPTCSQDDSVEGGVAEEAEPADAEGGAEGEGRGADDTERPEGVSVATDAAPGDASSERRTGTATPSGDGTDTPTTADGEPEPSAAPEAPRPPQVAPDVGRGTRGESSADVAGSRAAIVRKLASLARRAEETDDVARSRELLLAVREAAEAVAAIDELRE